MNIKLIKIIIFILILNLSQNISYSMEYSITNQHQENDNPVDTLKNLCIQQIINILSNKDHSIKFSHLYNYIKLIDEKAPEDIKEEFRKNIIRTNFKKLIPNIKSKNLKISEDINSIAISNNNRFMALGCYKSLYIINTESSIIALQFKKLHTGRITTIAFNEDNNLIVTGSNDNTCCIIDPIQSKIIEKLSFSNEITAACISNNYLTLGFSNGDVNVYSLKEDMKELYKFTNNESAIIKILINKKNFLIASTKGNNIYIYDLNKGTLHIDLQKNVDHYMSLISNDNRLIIKPNNTHTDNTLEIWDIENNRCIETLNTNANKIKCFTLTRDSKYIIIGCSCTIMIFKLDNTITLISQIHNSNLRLITSINTSPDNKIAIISCWNGTTKILDIEHLDKLDNSIINNIELSDINFNIKSNEIYNTPLNTPAHASLNYIFINNNRNIIAISKSRKIIPILSLNHLMNEKLIDLFKLLS